MSLWFIILDQTNKLYTIKWCEDIGESLFLLYRQVRGPTTLLCFSQSYRTFRTVQFCIYYCLIFNVVIIQVLKYYLSIGNNSMYF